MRKSVIRFTGKKTKSKAGKVYFVFNEMYRYGYSIVFDSHITVYLSPKVVGADFSAVEGDLFTYETTEKYSKTIISGGYYAVQASRRTWVFWAKFNAVKKEEVQELLPVEITA